MMAIIALISDLINALIQAIGAISPDAAHAIQQALSQAFDFITSLLTLHILTKIRSCNCSVVHLI